MAGALPVKKRSRVNLTVEDKILLIRGKDAGVSNEELADEYGVSERTVQKLCRMREQILQHEQHPKAHLMKHTRMQSRSSPVIENAVECFRTLLRRESTHATGPLLQSCALSVARDISLDSFKASDSWLNSFLKRRPYIECNETSLAGDPKISFDGVTATFDLENGRNLLPGWLQNYDIDDIYNMEKGELLYRLPPQESYPTQSREDGKPSVKNIQYMSSKDRVTMYVCTNATGTHKLPLSVIGSGERDSLNSHNLTTGVREHMLLGPDNAHYIFQRDAWSDSFTLRSWFINTFLPAIQEKQEICEKRSLTEAEGSGRREIALVLNVTCGNPKDTTIAADIKAELSRLQIQVFFLPPNRTNFGIRRPMDIGVITMLKNQYRLKMIEVLATLYRYQGCFRTSDHRAADALGLAEGRLPLLADAIQLLSLVWASRISKHSIIQAWMHADILSASHREVLEARLQRVLQSLPAQMVDRQLRQSPFRSAHGKENGLTGDSAGHNDEAGEGEIGNISESLDSLDIVGRLRSFMQLTFLGPISRGEMDIPQSSSPDSPEALIPNLVLFFIQHTKIRRQRTIIEKWLNVEDDKDVRYAIYQDHLEVLRKCALTMAVERTGEDGNILARDEEAKRKGCDQTERETEAESDEEEVAESVAEADNFSGAAGLNHTTNITDSDSVLQASMHLEAALKSVGASQSDIQAAQRLRVSFLFHQSEHSNREGQRGDASRKRDRRRHDHSLASAVSGTHVGGILGQKGQKRLRELHQNEASV